MAAPEAAEAAPASTTADITDSGRQTVVDITDSPSSQRLGVGTRVTIQNLQSRAELNGIAARVLLHDAASGRYGVRVPKEHGGGRKPLAIKRANLEPLPFERVGSADKVDHLLALPTDVLEALLRHLSARSLCRFSAACALCNSLYAAGSGTWTALLSHPLIAPYHAPHRDGTGVEAYRGAVARRNRWFDGSIPSGPFFDSETLTFTFERFVRAVAIDLTDERDGVIAIGQSTGAVAAAGLVEVTSTRRKRTAVQRYNDGETRVFVEGLDGEAHEEQTLAIAVHAGSRLIVSGCGRPAYPVAYAPFAYTATVKVWQLDENEHTEKWMGGRTGTLVHTCDGHSDAIRCVQLLDMGSGTPSYAASGSADKTVCVWHVREGKLLHSLAGHHAPVLAVFALSDSRRLLSVDESAVVREWDWRTGEPLRTLSTRKYPSSGVLTAVSFHEPSCTLAMGGGGPNVDLHLVALALERTAPPYTQLLSRELFEEGGGQRSAFASIQHDDDKLVSVSRDGWLTTLALRQKEEPAGPFAMPWNKLGLAVARRWARGDTHTFDAGAPSDLGAARTRRREGIVGCKLFDERRVRYYVSSVRYVGGVLVHDGLDDAIQLMW